MLCDAFRVGYTPVMSTVSIEEIARDLLGYLQRVRDGETLLIVQGDQPVAEIKPVPALGDEPRPFGLCAGEIVVSDDFDAPLPADLQALFDGQ